jgi:hypothetical protein
MDAISSISLASGLSWASGLRLYATVFIIGLLGKFGFIHLPQGLEILTNPTVIAVSGILSTIEFLADKFPYIDSLWDSFHTFIRIPAGALLAIGAIDSSDPAITAVTALLGGTIAAATHLTKAGSRALINTSPEPVSNIAASVGEEGLFVLGGWLALTHPVLFIGLLILLMLGMFWFLPKLWRGIRLIFSRFGTSPAA